MDHREKPGTPGEILEHHGIKGMRWGVRKQEERGSVPSGYVDIGAQVAEQLRSNRSPEFRQRVATLTKTDRPQMLGAQRKADGKIQAQPKEEKHGLSRNQKIALGVGGAALLAGGYVAYRHYAGKPMPGLPNRDLLKAEQEVQAIGGHKLPKNWDVHGLAEHPISTQKLGDLAGDAFEAKLVHPENLVINTSRGYADILPKNGFSNPFAAEQHDSAVRVLEEMRDKFPAIRNMNIEVLPMSAMGLENHDANMCVLPMRAGEARLMYNDVMAKPTADLIRANKDFLPGLGVKDYVARHEMGHLLATAHGELPPAFDILAGRAGPSVAQTRATVEPLLHKRMFLKHGFTFSELSKISGYAATQPAEAMAELFGHLHTPEMRSRLTPDQIKRATAMFDEMGGVTQSAAGLTKNAAGGGTSQFGRSAAGLVKNAAGGGTSQFG